MAFTGKNLTREEMEELIETLLCTDLNNEDTAHLIMEFVDFYIKKSKKNKEIEKWKLVTLVVMHIEKVIIECGVLKNSFQIYSSVLNADW